MRKKRPNRLLESGYMILGSGDPLVGVLVMDTDKGVIDVAINRVVAEELRAVLTDFLAGKQSQSAT